jgi:hypothetical protein
MAAVPVTMPASAPVTVAGLIAQVASHRPEAPLAMLRSTAAHLERYLGVPATNLPLNTVHDALPGFAQFLGQSKQRNGKPLTRNSIRSYINYARILLNLAAELGWVRTPGATELAWQAALAGHLLPEGCPGLVRFGVARGIPPQQFDDADLDAFIGFKVANGRHPKYARKVASAFRGFLADRGLSGRFPRLSPPRRDYFFGIPAGRMPEPLRSEVRALVNYKLRPASRRLPRPTRASGRQGPARLRRGVKIRDVSARTLESAISRVYGFAVTERNIDPGTSMGLLDLIDEPTIDAYIDWQLDERCTSGANFAGVRMLHAAVRQCPAYRELDFGWFTELLATIPEEDEEAVSDRKSEFYVPWAELCAIPGKIAAEKAKETPGTLAYARLARDELFMLWMVTFAWRGLNVRTCKLGANLFKRQVDMSRNSNLDEWVKEALAESPQAEFWQIHFSRDEAKAREAIRGFVPQHVIPLLEDYIENQRPLLVGETDRGTLFLNSHGNPLSAEAIEDLYGRLTQRYAGRWSRPHLVRDAFAHAWLDAHPGDYLTVSRALWHRSLRHTIRRYGRTLDPAHALGKTGTWAAKFVG